MGNPLARPATVASAIAQETSARLTFHIREEPISGFSSDLGADGSFDGLNSTNRCS
jgi:hypothetical protein